MRYKDVVLTMSTAKSAEGAALDGEEVFPWVMWNQNNKYVVYNENQTREQQLEVIQCYGDASLVLPMTYYIYGNAPANNEYTCAISEYSAKSLWSTTDVIGNILLINEKEYTVSGVFKEPNNVLVLPVVEYEIEQDNEKIEFCAAEFKMPSGKDITNINNIVDKFTNNSGIAKGEIINYNSQSNLVQQMIMIPGIVILLIAVLSCISIINNYSRSKIVPYLALVILAVVGISLLQFKLSIGNMALPTKWSDFEFWAEQWQAFSTTRDTLKTIPGYRIDILREEAFNKVIIFILAASMCFIISSISIRKIKPAQNVVLLIGIYIFMCILILFKFNVSLIRSIWIMWPYALVMNFGFGDTLALDG